MSFGKRFASWNGNNFLWMALVLSTVAIVAHGYFTYSGTYRWLTEGQAAILDGTHYPVFSVLIILLLLWAAVVSVLSLLGFSGSSAGQFVPGYWTTWYQQGPRSFYMFFGGLMMVGIGAWAIGTALWVGEAVNIEAAPLFDQAVTKGTATYIPLADGNVLYVGGGLALEKLQRGEPYQALEDPRGLPPDVRVVFGESGIDVTGARLYDWSGSWEKSRDIGTVFASIGLLLSLIAFLWRPKLS